MIANPLITSEWSQTMILYQTSLVRMNDVSQPNRRWRAVVWQKGKLIDRIKSEIWLKFRVNLNRNKYINWYDDDTSPHVSCGKFMYQPHIDDESLPVYSVHACQTFCDLLRFLSFFNFNSSHSSPAITVELHEETVENWEQIQFQIQRI